MGFEDESQNMPIEQPRFIGSASPYKGMAEKYRAAGFYPIPLPPGKKNPPPTGWTGHGRPLVTDQQIAKWMHGTDKLYWHNPTTKRTEQYDISKANIGLRLGPISVAGELFEIVGIDVDHHPEVSDDPKNGGPQLEYFEKTLGNLPDTWTSSARTNGIAGIRFYLVPKGLMWRGDLGHGGEDIDIISRNYRFAVCFPSINPDANNHQYWWYPPGFAPDGDLDAIDRAKYGLIPKLQDLPHLPDKWVDYLTNNRIADIGVPIDMNSTTKQLTRWAMANFPVSQEVCEYMTVILDQWKGKLDESAKSHNVLTAAHYHILKCGVNEGHTGWLVTVKEFEKHYSASVLGRNKRSMRECKAEIERSRFGALRRLKGEADKAIEEKQGYFATGDPCENMKGYFDGSGGGVIPKPTGDPTGSSNSNGAQKVSKPPAKYGHGWPKSRAKDPNEYELNDDGNGEHWLDIHDGVVRYISNVHQKWMVWDGKRWHVDEKSTIARHLFRRVKVRQHNFTEKMREEYKKIAGTPTSKILRAKIIQWEKHTRQSGMVRDIDRALQAAQSLRQDVSIKYEDLDADRRALGCMNGVVRIEHSGEVKLIENSKEMLITRNTKHDYVRWEQIDRESKGFILFDDFLNRFVSSAIDLNYFQKLCGSILLGNNTEKMAVFFWGQTDTAKSTMLKLMVDALGEYADMRNPDIFKSRHLNPALASSLSMRLMGISEMGDNEINSELFKNITGGERIVCELKNQNNLVSDIPQFTPIVTTNSIPRVPGEDTAFRNRLRVIEFKHQATDEEKASGNQQRMYEHSPTVVLSWLVEGASRYAREGLGATPVEILMATEEFASKLSDLADFAQTVFVPMTDGFVRYEDVMFRFKDWADKNNFNVKGWTSTKLTQKLRAIGYVPGRKWVRTEAGDRHQVRGFVGVSLNSLEGQVNSGN